MMESIRLINNSGLESDKNLCFVNTAVQLLYSLPEVRKFFIHQEYKTNQEENADLTICNELSRIFKTAGKFVASTATLRLLVGHGSGNPDISSDTQQDIIDFLRLLLQQIEIE